MHSVIGATFFYMRRPKKHFHVEKFSELLLHIRAGMSHIDPELSGTQTGTCRMAHKLNMYYYRQ